MHVKKSATIVSLMTVCLFVGSARAQTTQPAANTLTPEERESALKLFQTTHDNFLKSIAGLSDKQWKFKPAPDRWSVAEVAEHITVAETVIMGLIQHPLMQSPSAPEKRELVKGKDRLILEKMPDRSHKAQAPEILLPTGVGRQKRT